ncbi:hypothetical protein KKD62_02805 [Patescibacteria group bacterium]|nr:hypothetical protein [Patescibacteria group bacterium]MBU1931830.1 hypothetical protein [Patescibacteria group bacterium]
MSKRFLTYLTLFVLFCLVWWWRFQAERSQDLKSGMQVKLTGRVASEPILQGAKQRFSIGKFTVIAPSFPYYQYGEKLIITGTLEQQVINSYFSRFSLIYPDIVQFTSDNNQKRGFRAKLLAWRQQLEGQFNQLLPEPEASLLSGVVLGSRREMPADFWQALRATGTLRVNGHFALVFLY